MTGAKLEMEAPMELFVPLEDLVRIPADLRRELTSAVGRYIAGILDSKGIAEEEILKDFDDFRRRR